MTIPRQEHEQAVALLRRLIAIRAPSDLHDSYRLELETRGDAITLFAHRAPWQPTGRWSKAPVAQLRYGTDGTWALYWSRANEQWARYQDPSPSAPLAILIAEINEDPDGVFWD